MPSVSTFHEILQQAVRNFCATLTYYTKTPMDEVIMETVMFPTLSGLLLIFY